MKTLRLVDTETAKAYITEYMKDVLNPSPVVVCKLIDDHTFIEQRYDNK